MRWCWLARTSPALEQFTLVRFRLFVLSNLRNYLFSFRTEYQDINKFSVEESDVNISAVGDDIYLLCTPSVCFLNDDDEPRSQPWGDNVIEEVIRFTVLPHRMTRADVCQRWRFCTSVCLFGGHLAGTLRKFGLLGMHDRNNRTLKNNPYFDRLLFMGTARCLLLLSLLLGLRSLRGYFSFRENSGSGVFLLFIDHYRRRLPPALGTRLTCMATFKHNPSNRAQFVYGPLL